MFPGGQKQSTQKEAGLEGLNDFTMNPIKKVHLKVVLTEEWIVGLSSSVLILGRKRCVSDQVDREETPVMEDHQGIHERENSDLFVCY